KHVRNRPAAPPPRGSCGRPGSPGDEPTAARRGYARSMQGDDETGADAAAVRALGAESTRAVYRDLLRFGPRSRSELSQRLRLSAPTVTRVTRDLLERDLLHPLTAVQRAKGRPQEPLDIEENRGPRFIGVKVTAEEVHAVVTSVRAVVLEELVLPLAGTAPELVVQTVLEAVEAMLSAHPRVSGVGVGLGGLVAERRTVLSAHLLGWQEPVELAAALEARVPVPVVVENDLVAMVDGLHWFGGGRSYDSFVVLTVGAGVGIGAVVDGRVVRGHRHMAGLTGLFPLGAGPGSVPIRDVASTASVVRRAREQGVLGAAEGIEELRGLIARGRRGVGWPAGPRADPAGRGARRPGQRRLAGLRGRAAGGHRRCSAGPARAHPQRGLRRVGARGRGDRDSGVRRGRALRRGPGEGDGQPNRALTRSLYEAKSAPSILRIQHWSKAACMIVVISAEFSTSGYRPVSPLATRSVNGVTSRPSAA